MKTPPKPGTRIERYQGDESEPLAHCHHIRRTVFCDEQGVAADLEWDDLDPACTHYLLFVNDTPGATARIRPYKPGQVKIERVAALKAYRGQGLGRLLMERILADLKGDLGDLQKGPATEAILNAQTAVRDFYAALGFVAVGPEFVEADIPHIHMRLKL